jgi:hypothetical protein
LVLGKGATQHNATPSAGKWNNTDLKVMIQWFKIAMAIRPCPRTKKAFSFGTGKNGHTCVVEDTSTYPHE